MDPLVVLGLLAIALVVTGVVCAAVLRFSEHMEGAAGEAMFRHACAMGLEGFIAKLRHEPLQVGLVPELAQGEEPGL